MSRLAGEAGELWTVCDAIAKKPSKAPQFAGWGLEDAGGAGGGQWGGWAGREGHGRRRQLVQLRQGLVQLEHDDVAATKETPLFAVSFVGY